MKIAQSAVTLGYEYQKNTSQAQVTSQRVQTLSNSASGNETQSHRAGIVQSQQQTLTDSIHLRSQSLVTDKQSGDAQYFENADFLQAVSSIFVEEDMTVTSLQALGNNQVNAGVSLIEVTSISQFESDTQVQANAMGTLTTEDGREIGFMLELEYNRTIQTTQESTFTGQRNLIDPLVINLNGGIPSLSDTYFEFDLNSDGQTEILSRTGQGTGFLALDKNQNGEIDNGQELFGPNSNSGFGELAQYDNDGNGWIDESDAIFSQLTYMDFDEHGQQRIQSIGDVGVGAIYLGSEKMDIDLFDSNGNFQANIARNGVAIKENGQAVSLQEIHYSDQAIGKISMEVASSMIINNQLIANGGTMDVQISNGINTLQATRIQIESPLTQFQFDNEIINGRNADTQVRIDRADQTGFMTINGIRTPLNSDLTMAVPDTTTQTASNAATETSPTPDASRNDRQYASAQNRRDDIRSAFQAKIESGISVIRNTSSQSNKNQSAIDVPTLSQSVFWQDERQTYQNKYEGGSKLDQLKQLVEDLKSIREQQLKSQEKLGLYIKIENGV